MSREFIAHSTKMLHFPARLSTSASSHHDLSLVAFITNIVEFDFRYTHPLGCWKKEMPNSRPVRGAQANPKGARNGNYKHGRRTAEAIGLRRWLRRQIREVRALTGRLRQV